MNVRRLLGRGLVGVIRGPGLAALRLCARIDPRSPVPGVTIIIVNWNSRDILRVALTAIERFAAPDTRIIVLDNGSRDGSREFLRAAPVRSVLLPVNIHHWAALDMGVLLARTEFVVTLDVDAFPVSSDWLQRLIPPLNQGFVVSGGHWHREYVHPCCLAMRRRDFISRGHSFRPRWNDGSELGTTSWDTGESISLREPGRVSFLEPTEHLGPRRIGVVFGGIVYHNFYLTRFAGTQRHKIESITREDAFGTWDLAVARFLDGPPAGRTQRALRTGSSG